MLHNVAGVCAISNGISRLSTVVGAQSARLLEGEQGTGGEPVYFSILSQRMVELQSAGL